MTKDEQARAADAFARRHRQKPILLLPNAWDGASARIFAAAGFEAIATTSGGVAWSLGYPDGEGAPWHEVVEATARIVRAARVPVTADIESGYGRLPEDVARSVTEIIGAGVVGINLEDGVHADPPLRSMADAARRIRAAREAARLAGVPIVINARCDVYFQPPGDEAQRFADAVDRCREYLAAGADCVYLFGLRDADTVGRLVGALAAPINITGRAGMANAASWEKLGVARITIASAPALVSYAAVKTLAEDLRATGRFDGLAASLRHPDAQALFARA